MGIKLCPNEHQLGSYHGRNFIPTAFRFNIEFLVIGTAYLLALTLSQNKSAYSLLSLSISCPPHFLTGF